MHNTPLIFAKATVPLQTMSMESHKSTSHQALSVGFARPLVTVDVVILTLDKGVLQVLLVQRPGNDDDPFPNAWALPGGFIDVQQDANLEACALRKLREKTAVESTYLEQVGSWGSADRDPRGWSNTNLYFALLPQVSLQVQKGGNAANVRWFEVTSDGATHGAGILAFDHGELLAAALQRLRSKVEYTSLPAFLLQQPFTLPQLQNVYEVVLGRPLDRSSFRKRALDMPGFLEASGVLDTGAPRAPMGYTLVNPRCPSVFPRSFEPR